MFRKALVRHILWLMVVAGSVGGISAILAQDVPCEGGAFCGAEPFATPEKQHPTDRIMLAFEDQAAADRLLGETRRGMALAELTAVTGVPLFYLHPSGLQATHVLALADVATLQEVERISADLAALPGVAWAEPDRLLFLISDPDPAAALHLPAAPERIPNDTRWSDMWHLRYTARTNEGVNMVPAWDITTGSTSTVVAVLDTGILPHADLAGRTVPGYDFISDARVANDGNARDSNPADPGDWITAAESSSGFFQGCQVSNSSWHGTHVAGTIGAASNNSLGIAGIDWRAKILPVRVLGKCGGYNSDIIDGMLWAAGLAVPDVPANANRAKVLNLSLGGSGACSTAMQNAINAITGAGSVVIVAAGNSNANAGNFTPASCNNVITVAATNRTGNRAFYSNYGASVAISAPGGETNSSSTNGVLSTLDSGTQGPANSNSYAWYQGTSMAAPHVAGVASLIVGLRPDYTPAQLRALLRSTARPFPSGSTCTTANCGSGIVDATRALNTLTNPPATRDIWLPIVMRPVPTVTLGNPGFESGATVWSWYSLKGWEVILNYQTTQIPVAPRSGNWLAWLGGDNDEASWIQQSVSIPAATPHLAWWHWIASEDFCGYDIASVQINGNPVTSYSLCETSSTGGWVQRSVNLSAYAGQTVTLRFQVTTDSSLNSNLFLDDFSFRATAAAMTVPESADTPAPLFTKPALLTRP